MTLFVRNRLTEFMQSHRFWLVDIVPSAAQPFYVLGAPFLGFQSITSPEYVFDTEQIKQVNSMFKKTVYTGGAVSPITLTRGVTGYDDTMWEWTHRAIKGSDFPNRTLLLIHYTQIVPGGPDVLGAIADPFSTVAWEGAARVPGKAWLLWDCVPTRYKAGSDFEGENGAVSIAELEIQPEAITEFTLLAP